MIFISELLLSFTASRFELLNTTKREASQNLECPRGERLMSSSAPSLILVTVNRAEVSRSIPRGILGCLMNPFFIILGWRGWVDSLSEILLRVSVAVVILPSGNFSLGGLTVILRDNGIAAKIIRDGIANP